MMKELNQNYDMFEKRRLPQGINSYEKSQRMNDQIDLFSSNHATDKGFGGGVSSIDSVPQSTSVHEQTEDKRQDEIGSLASYSKRDGTNDKLASDLELNSARTIETDIKKTNSVREGHSPSNQKQGIKTVLLIQESLKNFMIERTQPHPQIDATTQMTEANFLYRAILGSLSSLLG